MAIARPQIRSAVVPENPLYRTGVDSVPDVPWAQVEWSAIDTSVSEDGIARPEYGYMEPSLVDALDAILVAQAKGADNFRYAAVPHWLCAAGHVLVATPPFLRAGEDSLTSGVGGWFQRPASGVCTPKPYATSECAEVFSIFRIHRESAHYVAADYVSEGVHYLVHRGRAPGDASNFTGFGEVLSPSEPDPFEGVLRIRWRHAFSVQYQAAAYRFDPATRIMRFRYGALLEEADVADPLAIAAPALPLATDACMPEGVVCMSQASYGRF